MDKAKLEFAKRLLAALEAAGVPPKPAVLEREFNLRYWGKPVTLHAVRLWLKGETIPAQDRLLCLAQWLNIEPAILRFGEEVPMRIRHRKARWEKGVGFQERELFELFLQLPVPARKLARELVIVLAKAHGVLPLSA
jgi:hypothetical protein